MTELTLLDKIFSEFGIVAGLFILIILGVIWTFYKAGNYLPRLVDKHFSSIENMTSEHVENQKKSQIAFSKSLSEVTVENKKVTSDLINQIKIQSDEHKEIIKEIRGATSVLQKLDRTQDKIYDKVTN